MRRRGAVPLVLGAALLGALGADLVIVGTYRVRWYSYDDIGVTLHGLAAQFPSLPHGESYGIPTSWYDVAGDVATTAAILLEVGGIGSLVGLRWRPAVLVGGVVMIGASVAVLDVAIRTGVPAWATWGMWPVTFSRGPACWFCGSGGFVGLVGGALALTSFRQLAEPDGVAAEPELAIGVG